ncbi:MAG: hypothetical protein ACR5LF_02790 [Symbiopectobacterium sp.]
MHGSTSDLVVPLGDCNGDYKPIGYATTSNAITALNGLFNYSGTESIAVRSRPCSICLTLVLR